jgi:Sortase domain
VLVGHVDSRTGPAVFYRLRELAPGDEVLVDRADGTTARFIATSLDSYEKALFPSDLIYYPTLEPQLRLVTCGGPFDPSTGHYRDNVVVFADAAA